MLHFFFFFQAEDGIRDLYVTGVQTCALPISLTSGTPAGFQIDVNVANLITNTLTVDFNATGVLSVAQLPLPGHPADHLDNLDDLIGVVQSLDTTNSKFTLHSATADFPVQANTST